VNKSFVEMVIEGPELYVRGYLRGWVDARGERAEVIFSDEIGINDDDIVQKVKEALHLSRHYEHLLADAETAELVAEAIAGEQYEKLNLHSNRPIERGEFTYEFQVYNREHGELVQRTFDELPEGIVLEKHNMKLKENPDAKGVEMYSPAHDYELKGAGKASGPIGKIIWLHKALASFDQVDAGEITLIFA